MLDAQADWTLKSDVFGSSEMSLKCQSRNSRSATCTAPGEPRTLSCLARLGLFSDHLFDPVGCEMGSRRIQKRMLKLLSYPHYAVEGVRLHNTVGHRPSSTCASVRENKLMCAFYAAVFNDTYFKAMLARVLSFQKVAPTLLQSTY